MTLDEHFFSFIPQGKCTHIFFLLFLYWNTLFLFICEEIYLGDKFNSRHYVYNYVKYKNTFSGTSIRMLSSIYNSVPVKS